MLKSLIIVSPYLTYWSPLNRPTHFTACCVCNGEKLAPGWLLRSMFLGSIKMFSLSRLKIIFTLFPVFKMSSQTILEEYLQARTRFFFNGLVMKIYWWNQAMLISRLDCVKLSTHVVSYCIDKRCLQLTDEGSIL